MSSSLVFGHDVSRRRVFMLLKNEETLELVHFMSLVHKWKKPIKSNNDHLLSLFCLFSVYLLRPSLTESLTNPWAPAWMWGCCTAVSTSRDQTFSRPLETTESTLLIATRRSQKLLLPVRNGGLVFYSNASAVGELLPTGDAVTNLFSSVSSL